MSRALALILSVLIVASFFGPASAAAVVLPGRDQATATSRWAGDEGCEGDGEDGEDEECEESPTPTPPSTSTPTTPEPTTPGPTTPEPARPDTASPPAPPTGPQGPSAPGQPACANASGRGCPPPSRGETPIVYDDDDGLSEGEQWTRKGPDTHLDELAETLNLGPTPTSFAAVAPVGVAVIDTGVAEVPGLDHVIHGPDLSFDSQAENLTHADGYGHGTHMAGIIGGRGVVGPDGLDLVGVAPDADLYSIKVGSHSGAVDVTQVIAAIDWVAQHAEQLNIRVLNLSYGTDSVQPWHIDPLAYAVETAWRHGVVVVVSGGNDGQSRAALRNPAINPWVLAVGASDSNGTPAVGDDLLAPFSNRGTDDRRADVLAPGVGVVSYRVPGSVLDEAYPTARRGEAGFSGSGSSQSAAVVTGLVARLLQAHPDATPDQVKAALIAGAQPIPGGDPATGAGVVDLAASLLALADPTSLSPQELSHGEATGTLDAARGTMRLQDGPGHFARRVTAIILEGEVDIHGQPFDVPTWAAASAARRAWIDGTWNGVEWTGSGFDGDVWQGHRWTGSSWTGRSWSGRSWSGRSWSGRSWSGDSWDADGGLFLAAGWLSLNPW